MSLLLNTIRKQLLGYVGIFVSLWLNNYLFLITLTSTVFAQTTLEVGPDFREEEFFQVEQLVAIGSRRLQHLSQSPSAVSIITADDIRQSGVVDIVDLFRMIPGMDVITLDGPRSSVSVRGFPRELADTTLVMIDHRIVFLHQQGATFWRTIPIFLENIERIEILRGPGSTLYGINALTGVIHIITKDPEKYKGWVLSETIGSNELLLGTLIYDGIYDRQAAVGSGHSSLVTHHSSPILPALSYRFSLGYQQDSGFDEDLQGSPLRDDKRIPKVAFQFKYNISENSDLRVSTGHLNGDRQGRFPVPGRPFGESGQEDFESFFIQSWYEKQFSSTSNLFIQIYWNALNADFIFSNPILGIREFDFDTLGAEFQYNFRFLNQHELVLGGDYILDFLDAPQFGIHTIQDSVFGLYIQDEYKLWDQLTVVAGIRIQDNTLSGTDITPRGTLLYTPWENHTFRFSVGQAVTPPSQFNAFIDTVTILPNRVTVARLPNLELDSEVVTAYEIGYRTYLFDKLHLNVELYYNDFDKVGRLVLVSLPPGITSAFMLEDEFSGFSKGVEIDLIVPLTSWLQGRTNYTYELIDINDEGVVRPGALDKPTPRHKANLGLRTRFKNGFSTNLQVNYVDQTAPESDPTISLDPYIRLDVRIAQSFLNDTIEVALTGQNLVDLHAESEVAILDRLFFASMTWKF